MLAEAHLPDILTDTTLSDFDALAPPQPPLLSTPSTFNITIPGLPKSLMLHQDTMPGCGGQIWPAGEMLAEYITWRTGNHGLSESWSGFNVLELGAGLGIVGLAAACIEGIADVLMTDQAQLMPLLQKSIELNVDSSTRHHLHAAVLSWGDPLPTDMFATNSPNVTASASFNQSSRIDVVLAADCIYFEPAFDLLIKTLLDIFARADSYNEASPLVLFAFKKRRKADKHFWQHARKRGLVFEQVTLDHVHAAAATPWNTQKWSAQGVFLYQITQKSIKIPSQQGL